MLSPTQAKILRFFIAGTASTLVNLTLLYAVEYLHFHYIAAALAAYLGSLAFGFTVQKFWSFRNRDANRIHFQLAEYSAVTIINMGINTALMYVFVSLLGLWYLFAQVIAAALLAVTSYLAYNSFVFRSKKSPTSSSQSQ
jgi:putative flippase GtrA